MTKHQTRAGRATHSSVDTIIITPELVKSWRRPGFQRPVRVNAKVAMIAEQLKEDGGVLPGMLTLGEFGGDTWIVDGQHRLEAFAISALREGYCDIRRITFATMADMANEYLNMNSKIAAMKPDDLLRGLEPSMPMLKTIREACPFVGYDLVRRTEKAPILSMAVTLRSWRSSASDVPSASGVGGAIAIAQALTEEDARGLVSFLNCAYSAWGRDDEYARLWGALNMTMSMWLFRRCVLGHKRTNVSRYVTLTTGEFTRTISALSASGEYLDWLVGRKMNDRDRSPCMTRVRALIAHRLKHGLKKPNHQLPQESWMTSMTATQRIVERQMENANQ